MPSLDEFPDIAELVDNERYDMRISKFDSYLIINVQYIVYSLRGISEFDRMFPVAHFQLLLDFFMFLIRSFDLNMK